MAKSIGTSGFASDGAWHLDQDANNEAAITWDRTRHNPNVVLHGPYFKSGYIGNESNHLIGHWKCDDNAASTTVVDETGNYNGTLEGGDNTQDKDNADAIRGTSFLLNGTDDALNFTSSLAGLTTIDEFTIMLSFKPNTAYDGANQGVFSIYYDGDTNISFYYYAVSGRFRVIWDVAAGNSNAPCGPTFTSNNDFQQWHTILLSVNITNGSSRIVFDTIVTPFVMPVWGTTPTNFKVGYAREIGIYGNFYIDNIKLLDGCILPYGSYFTGNRYQIYDDAEETITFYWDCESSGANASNIPSDKTITLNGSAAIVSGGVHGSNELDTVNYNDDASVPVTDSDIINFNKGSASLWVKFNTLGSADDWFFGIGVYDNEQISMKLNSSNIIEGLYESQSTQEVVTSSITATVGQWYHVRLTWDDTDYVHLYINGIEEGTPQVIANTWSGSTTGTLYIGAAYSGGSGCDCSIDQVFITNNPNTPQNWTAFGKPLQAPILEIS